MDFSSAFKAADLAGKLTSNLLALLKTSKGHKRRILLELQGNLDLLSLWQEGDFQVENVISKLERVQYDKALNEDFHFPTLQKKSLSAKTTKNVPQFKKYIGWNTEKLVDNLYRKIAVLKKTVQMPGHNKTIDLKARLLNIYKMHILLLHHLAD